MLDDILAGIGSEPTPARGGGGGSSFATPAGHNPFARSGGLAPGLVTPTPRLGGGAAPAQRRAVAPTPLSRSVPPPPRFGAVIAAAAAAPAAEYDDAAADAAAAAMGADEAADDAAGASEEAAGGAPVLSSAAWQAQLDAAAGEAAMETDGAAADVAPARAAPAFTLAPKPVGPAAAELGWAAAAAGDDADAIPERDPEPARLAADGSLPLDADGSLPFFFLDAYEDGAHAPGTVFLFGKVPVPGGFASACAAVEGLQRCVFAVPSPQAALFDDADGELAALEDAAAAAVKAAGGEHALKAALASVGGAPPAGTAMEAAVVAKGALMKALQKRAAPLKAELRDALLGRGVSSFTMRPVRRSYAFERGDVPRGAQYVLKVKYSAAEPALPSDMKGRSFCALFGTQASCSELLLLKRRIMGPSWLALAGGAAVPDSRRRSHCRLELTLAGAKGVGPAVPAANTAAREPPPLVVASLNLKTVLNHRQNVNEIAAASVVICRAASCDAPMAKAEWNTAAQLRHFSIVRRLEGVSFPPGWDDAVSTENATNPAAKRAGAPVLQSAPSERALLSLLLARLHQADVDVYVGHNIAGFDLDVLLHRLQAHKVGNWSQLGRLKRTRFPSLGGGGGAFGGGAGAGALSVLAGRLLADTYLAAREYVREVSYTLTALAQRQLGLPRAEVAAADIPGRYASADALLGLAKAAEADAWLALGLLFHFNVLPLTRQLTCLSGSLWAKTLAGARAQRIEYLLLHEFHGRKFLVPDKLSFKEKARVAKAAAADDDMDGGADDGAGGGDDAPGKGRKRGAPAYAGGLVLEPKKGLYDKFVLLLDFNSLYPSIIQEYNICFTTVTRPEQEGALAALPAPAPGEPGGEGAAVLPQVLRVLVQRRRAVKELLKGERDAGKRRQLDIRQQALKLTANSMYGCLGFTGSRFYAKPLAELVTCQGREILQATVDLVQSNLNLDVIYGDTDSIMIATGKDDLREVKAIGAAVKKEVNKRYRLLEIEQDGVFKAMLLLKKKKYAALKVEERQDGTLATSIEAKGLDIVRRDWCSLSKDVGNAVLGEILSGRPADDVVASIHALLRDCAAKVSAGSVPLEAFIITKQLTKRPEDYSDGASQPHVQVALRRAAGGKRDGITAGETVPYVICHTAAAAATAAAATGAMAPASGKGLADRAYHPEEVGGDVAVDVAYYLAQQVHPVVSRLCAPIAGTDASQLAEALGLDPSRFKGSAGGSGGAGGSARDDALLGAPTLDDDERFAACPPLQLRRRDGAPFTFAGAAALAAGTVGAEALLGGAQPGMGDKASGVAVTAPVARLSGAALANQLTLAAHGLISRYYDGWLRSDDELYPCDTRNVSLRSARDAPRGAAPPDAKCAGRMGRTFGDAALYTALCHLRRLVDVKRALARLDKEALPAAERAVAPVRVELEQAHAAMEAICERNAYRYVSLLEMCAVKTAAV